MRADVAADVKLGLVLGEKYAATESSILFYYNTTQLYQHLTSPSILYLHLPTMLLSTPDTYGVTCSSSDPLVEPAKLPLQKLQVNTAQSIYTIPVDHFLLCSSQELSFALCTMPLLQAATQVPTIATLELGSTTAGGHVFLSKKFIFQAIASHSLMFNNTRYTPIRSRGYELTKLFEGDYDDTLLPVYHNQQTCPIQHSIFIIPHKSHLCPSAEKEF